MPQRRASSPTKHELGTFSNSLVDNEKTPATVVTGVLIRTWQ